MTNLLPEIMYFVPCERASIDQLTNRCTCSFICEGMQAIPFDPRVIPSDAPAEVTEKYRDAKFVIPSMNILSAWYCEDVEPETRFEAYISFTAPDGREIEFAPPLEFGFVGTKVYRLLHITSPGTGRLYGVSKLTALVRRVGSEEWHRALTYPLIIDEAVDISIVPEETKP